MSDELYDAYWEDRGGLLADEDARYGNYEDQSDRAIARIRAEITMDEAAWGVGLLTDDIIASVVRGYRNKMRKLKETQTTRGE